MSDVEIRDILLKAAEDVQSGMWCKDVLFEADLSEYVHPWSTVTTEALSERRRCAMGSLHLAGMLLGGQENQVYEAADAVVARLNCPEKPANASDHLGNLTHGVADHNDHCLPDDPFEAGQQLAKLFRTTAESL